MLYTGIQSSSYQPNEELMSVKGKSITLFSEPSNKLNLSFRKDLTGGDNQTSCHNYGAKQLFTFNGSPHILCNRIPQLEGVDGGVVNRVRCIPYELNFVEEAVYAQASINMTDKVHLNNPNVEGNFPGWRACMMQMLIGSYTHPMTEPGKVIQHTRHLGE